MMSTTATTMTMATLLISVLLTLLILSFCSSLSTAAEIVYEGDLFLSLRSDRDLPW